MKNLEQQAIKDLIDVYTLFLEFGRVKKVSETAKIVYNNYIPAKTLISKKIMSFVSKLFPLAYPDADSNLEVITVKDAKFILAELKELNHNY